MVPFPPGGRACEMGGASARSSSQCSMGGAVVLYTCVFVLYSLMDVLGLMPQELRSAGVTLPALFARYYGDQVKVASI